MHFWFLNVIVPPICYDVWRPSKWYGRCCHGNWATGMGSFCLKESCGNVGFCRKSYVFFGGGRFLTLRLKLKNIYCSITIDYKYPVSIFMILWLIIFYFLFRYLLMQHLGQTYVLQQHHLITSNSNLRCESFGHSCHDR